MIRGDISDKDKFYMNLHAEYIYIGSILSNIVVFHIRYNLLNIICREILLLHRNID